MTDTHNLTAADALRETLDREEDARHAQNAEHSLEQLIERRADQAWAESAPRYDLREIAERRKAWAEFYRCQISAAESMRERAVERLGRLLDESTRGGSPHAR